MLSPLGNTQDNRLESLRKTQVPCRYTAAFAKQKDLVAHKSVDVSEEALTPGWRAAPAGQD